MLATDGNLTLGGEDFDDRLLEFLKVDFATKYNKSLDDNKRALRRLKTACERAKHMLSSSMQYDVEIDSLHKGVDYYTTISRVCVFYFLF